MLERTRRDGCRPEATQIKMAHGSAPPSCRVDRALPRALKPKQHPLSTATCRSCQCLIRFIVDRRCEGSANHFPFNRYRRITDFPWLGEEWIFNVNTLLASERYLEHADLRPGGSAPSAQIRASDPSPLFE